MKKTRTKSISQIILMLFLICSLSFASLGSFGKIENNTPSETLSSFFETWKTGDFKAGRTFFVDDEMIIAGKDMTESLEELENAENMDPQEKILAEIMIKKIRDISYIIKSERIIEDKAIVTVECTFNDMKEPLINLMTSLMADLLASAFTPNEEELERLMMQKVKEAFRDTKKINLESEVNLVKKDNKWFIDASDNLDTFLVRVLLANLSND